ncbi:MAG: NYN domain-containing protein [Minisyncoccia bacterium]
MAIIKQKDQRVGVFIDTQNLYHTAKHIYKRKVNFANVVKDVVAGRTLVRSIAYVITTENEDEKAFLNALTKAGIETKSKDLQIFYDGSKKADWDTGLAIDVVSMAAKLDVVIILSGDGDFAPLCEYLRFHGVQVEAATFGQSASAMLKEVVDDFYDLSSNSKKYLLGY